jgi:hypothetical protein
MKTSKSTLLATATAFGLACLTSGCDRTVSQSESEKVKSDGTVETKEKAVTVSPDGTTNKTEEKKTTPP